MQVVSAPHLQLCARRSLLHTCKKSPFQDNRYASLAASHCKTVFTSFPGNRDADKEEEGKDTGSLRVIAVRELLIGAEYVLIQIKYNQYILIHIVWSLVSFQ